MLATTYLEGVSRMLDGEVISVSFAGNRDHIGGP